MKIIERVSELCEWRNSTQASVGFIPTMGNLHNGHASLVNASNKACDKTVVSIFVNPTQFNQKSDFETYPKTFEDDLNLLSSHKVDVVFVPNQSTIYPNGFAHKISRVLQGSSVLCDAQRAGHFDGVLTVVMKLFQLVRPTKAFFGEKDFQQLLYIKQMVDDFFMNIDVVACPTFRESTGLAMSSRNNRLSVDSRERASKVYSWLSQNPELSFESLDLLAKNEGFELEYLEKHWGRVFVAFGVDGVRLVDNIQVNHASTFFSQETSENKKTVPTEVQS